MKYSGWPFPRAASSRAARPPLDNQADGSYRYVASRDFAPQRSGEGRHGLYACAVRDCHVGSPLARQAR